MLPTLDFGEPITKVNELKTILLKNDMDKLCRRLPLQQAAPAGP
jgi:hypothetical protein